MSRPRSRLSRPRKAPNTESFSPGGTQSHRRLCSSNSLPEKPKQLETTSRSGESGTPSPLPRPTRSPTITEASDTPRANTCRACRQRRRVSSSGGSRRSGLLQAYAANEGTQDVDDADWLAGEAFRLRADNKVELQQLYYRQLRDDFGLSAQMDC